MKVWGIWCFVGSGIAAFVFLALREELKIRNRKRKLTHRAYEVVGYRGV